MRIIMQLPFAILLCCMGLCSSGQENSGTDSPEKQVALTYFNEILNNKKLELLSTVYDQEFVFHTVSGEELKIMKDSSVFRFLKYLFMAFPDLHYTVDVAVSQGTDVAVYVTGTGTHKNEFHGFPASGNTISFKEAFFFRMRNNKISEAWGIVDLEGMKAQMKKK